ncbi:MAG: hypothetical protein SGJ27_07140 [Candidatus Melainabacteria bacterium]|nr:hypothetical protein [Candidatus Melainabacteria bacterium]
MFTSKLKDFAIIKLFANLFSPRRKRQATESPWLQDLDDRITNSMQNSANAANEAEEQMRQLCNEVQAELNESDRVVVRKERRHVDATSVDMKAWWGGAVATWDPIDGKNLDSINQQRRPRKAKWFDSAPGSDLGRPK